MPLLLDNHLIITTIAKLNMTTYLFYYSLEHTIPQLNYAKINYPLPSLTLDDLSDISDDLGRRRVFLTSPDDAFSEPPWITGKGVTEPKNGRSEAKSIIIVVDKGQRDLNEAWIVDDNNT